MSEFNKEKLRNILIQFRVPFGIDVLNSINEGDVGKPYMVVIDNISAELRFERIYDFRYKNDGADMAPFSKVDEDRSGILSHMKIQIFFDTQIFKRINIDMEMIRISSEPFVDVAIEYVNKFLKAYRDVSEQFWIRNLIKRDIFNYFYYLIDSDENNTSAVTLIPQHNPVRFNGGKEFELENEKDEILRKIVQTDYVSFRNELILNTEDNFNLGNYNIALLQAVMRFENFVYSNLLKKISKTKFNKFKKKDCGCLIGISEICTSGFKELFDVDFGKTKEFENLKEFAIKYRNKIVHGEIVHDIGQEISSKGINAIGDAENYLIENVFIELRPAANVNSRTNT